MVKVRCKFECTGWQHSEDDKQTVVSLVAVVDGSEENKTFAKYTPSGHLNIVIDDETEAAGFISQGKEYFIDIIDPSQTLEKLRQEQPEHLKMKKYKFRAAHNGQSVNPEISAQNEKQARKKLDEKYPGISIISGIKI